MIEMHQDGETFDTDDGEDDGYDDYPIRSGRGAELVRLVAASPALAIAALALAIVPLGFVEAAEEIGQTALFSSKSQNPSDLTILRASAGVRLVLAGVALVMALVAGLRIRLAQPHELDAEADARPPDPLWVRGIAGAALIVAIVAVIVSAVSLGYALSATAGPVAGG